MRVFTFINGLLPTRRFPAAMFVVLVFVSLNSFADVIKWRGGNGSTATDWNTGDNWDLKRVPGINDDVVIGDTDMANNKDGPVINDWADYTVKSLTIGEGKAVEFYMAPRSMRVTGDVKIGANGYLRNIGAQTFYGGSFTVAAGGRYSEVAYAENSGKGNASKVWPVTEFYGTGIISGLTVTDVNRGFSNLKISGSITLGSVLNLTTVQAVNTKNNNVSLTIPAQLYVTGTLNPANHAVKFEGSATASGLVFEVAQGGTIHVTGTNFIDNYTSSSSAAVMFPTTLDALGVINYSGTGNQNILSPAGRSYGVLRISGSGIKSLTAATTILSDLFVDAGTLDILNYTFGRTGFGGTMNVANLATLKLSGSNFPANFATVDLGPNSTVNYYGAGQTVANVTKGYGNLSLTGNGLKDMPATSALVIAGYLEASGTGSPLTFEAKGSLAITGKVDLSGTASFNAGAFTHTVGGDWINNADFFGGTSTVILTGTGKKIERTLTTALSPTLRNEFYNLQVAGLGTTIKVPSAQSLTIRGNLETTGAGTLTQSAGGLTMAGLSKSISGTSIVLYNLTISGTTYTSASFIVNGNFETMGTGAFTATGGTITFTNTINNAGEIKNITHSGTGKTQFFGVNIAPAAPATKITTGSSFSIMSDLSGSGLEASAGIITFNGSSSFGGVHNLYNVVISGSALTMATNATMGIAGSLTDIALKFNAGSNVPNTVIYNGGAQSVTNTTYYNLQLSSNAGAVSKTAAGALTILGDISVNTNVTFAAGDDYTHNLYGNWKNSGTLSAGNGAFNFTGSANTSLTGATTFNIIRINKVGTSNFITLANNINTKDLYLTTGFMKTGANEVIVSGERYGNGWVEGTITKVKPGGFAATTEHLFNGPYVSINFGTISTPVTQVSVTTIPTVVTFSGATPVNRLYRVQTNGAYTKAKLRLQYEDSELNGNTEKSDEDGLKLSYSDSYPVGVNWSPADKKLNDYQANWVEDNGVTTANTEGYTNLNKYWALSDKPNRFVWIGKVNTKWEDKGNWYKLQVDGVTKEDPSSGPTSSDIVELGTEAHTYEPTIGSEVFVKGLQFKPDHNIILTISSTLSNGFIGTPALIVKGNIAAIGTSAQTHTINTGDQLLEVRSNLQLDNDLHKININKNAGEIIVAGALYQNSASLNLGSGNMRLKGDFIKTLGTFATIGTVTYEGSNTQIVADLDYHNLTIDKTGGVAQYALGENKTIVGNLFIKNGNLLMQSSNSTIRKITVNGNVTIGNSIVTEGVTTTTNGILNSANIDIDLKGNWNKIAGTFVPGTGTVTLAGVNTQSVSTSEFNNLIVANNTNVNGAIVVNGDVTVQQGKLSLGDRALTRSTVGGTFSLAAGASLDLKGADNFPANFNTNLLDTASTVSYSGTIAQQVKSLTYGKLDFTGGGDALPKTLQGATIVKGKLTIDESAKLDVSNQTLTLSGSFVIKGTFSPGTYTAPTPPTGTLILANTAGSTKYITGSKLTVNNMVISVGSMYALMAPFFTINGNLDITGDGNVYEFPDNPNPKERGFLKTSIPKNGYFVAANAKVDIAGDFRNSGMLFSNGTAKFLGVRKQTIQLLAPIIPHNGEAPTVEFTGTVAPVFNSTRSPEFANVTISLDNTKGEEIATSVGWAVAGIFTVMPNSTFNGGPYTHKLYSAFINKGTFKSSGLIDFSPPYPFAPAPEAHPFEFGTFESTGTLKFGGSGRILLVGTKSPQLNNLVIANTKGVTTTTLSKDYVLGIKDWTIDGNLVVESGGVLNAIPYVPGATLGTYFLIKGEIVNNGSIISMNPSVDPLAPFGIGADFTFAGADSKISGNGTTMLGNLTVNAASKLTVGKNVYLYGSLIHKGVDFSVGENTLTFIGAYPSAISTDPVSTLELSKLIVAKDAQTTSVSLGTNIAKLLSMIVQRGTLDLKDKTVTEYPDLVVEEPIITTVAALPGATIKVGGNSTLPAADVFSLAPTSTVEYYGASQQVRSVQYGNLALNNTATATFDTGTAKIAGNLIVKGESTQSVIAPETVEFNGAGNQIVAPLAYKNLTLSTGGTKTFAAKFEAEGNKVLSISGIATKAEGVIVDADDTGVHVNYNGTIAQPVLSGNYYDLTLSNGSLKTFSGITGVANTFTVVDGTAADLTSTETTIDFNGTGEQVIPKLRYSSIWVSKGGSKTLESKADVDIAKELRLTLGTINTGGDSKFILAPTAQIIESEGNSVTGKVQTTRTLTTATEAFGGMGLEITASVAPGEITVERQTGAGAAITGGTGNQSINRNFTFTGSTTAGNSTYSKASTQQVNSTDLNAKVVFKYFDSELNGLQAEEAELRLHNLVQGVNGVADQWVKHSGVAPDTYTNTLTSTGINSLTRMTLGSTIKPLPVELLSFTATKRGNNAELKWTTATEQNNQGFEVQVSVDGKNYERLGFVESRVGSSAMKQDYSFTDARSSKNGVQYYRLKQVDFDGTSKIYGPKTVNFGDIVAASPSEAYPNPFKDKLRVNISSPERGVATIKLYTATGRLLKTEALHVEAGVNDSPLALANTAYEPGLYMLVIELNGRQQTIKLMKE